MLVKLFGKVALLADDLGGERLGVEAELDAKFGVEVDEGVGGATLLLALDSVLSAELCHYHIASNWSIRVTELEMVTKEAYKGPLALDEMPMLIESER